jgi:HEAT repeat protein
MQTQNPVDASLVFDVVRHVATFGDDGNDQALVMALRRHLSGDVPDDIIELVLDRALHATDPAEDAWSKPASDGGPYFGGSISDNGMNCARGQAALVLGDLLIYDADGHPTQLVVPSLSQLASDPSVAVRSSVAHVLAASLRRAADEALAAFEQLIATDDRLLATNNLINLMSCIGPGRPAVVEPVIERMLASPHENVQRWGGYLAARAGLEFGLGHLLTAARESEKASIRTGAADLCARALPYTSDAVTASAALQQFVDDEDEEVRKAAAWIVAELRDKPLQPFKELLKAVVASPAFTEALGQLIFTLQAAPDRIDEIFLLCTQRFIEVRGTAAGDISTAAAGDAQSITQLTLRAYAQAPGRAERSQILDLIDGLLLIDAIGALEAVDQAER